MYRARVGRLMRLRNTKALLAAMRILQQYEAIFASACQRGYAMIRIVFKQLFLWAGKRLSTMVPDCLRQLTMIKKNYSKTGKKCRVTFTLPSQVSASSVLLLGEFNNWDSQSLPMKQLKNGDFSATRSLNAGQSYRFRYLLDENRWENDWAADGYVANEYGSDDSIVTV